MLVPKLSVGQKVRATTEAVPRKIGALLGSVRNPTRLIVSLALSRFPCTLNFRDGTIKSVTSRADLLEALHSYSSWAAESQLRTYWVNSLGRSVEIETRREYTGTEVFLDEIYARLPVSGRTVVDVGANIGDSPIYFALKGARRVLAYEPDPALCEVARRNIARNGIQNVTVFNASVEGVRDEISRPSQRVLREYQESNRSDISCASSDHLTLRSILAELNEAMISLKLDCEGWEYEIILSATREMLRNVNDIQLEYHFGIPPLASHLESLGYHVLASRPKFDVVVREMQAMVLGDLMARRN